MVQVLLQEQEEQVEVVVEAQVGILQGLLVLRILEYGSKSGSPSGRLIEL